MQEQSLLTPQEVAGILKLNLLTIYEYIRSHKLQAIKFGRKYRIEKETLDQFITDHLTT
jgi:putative molybdopterin biosynthesis protein